MKITACIRGLALAAILAPLPAVAQEFGHDATCARVNAIEQPRPSQDFIVNAGRQVGERLRAAYPNDAQVRQRAAAFTEREAQRSLEFAYIFCQLGHDNKTLLDVFVQVVVQRIANPGANPMVR